MVEDDDEEDDDTDAVEGDERGEIGTKDVG